MQRARSPPNTKLTALPSLTGSTILLADPKHLNMKLTALPSNISFSPTPTRSLQHHFPLISRSPFRFENPHRLNTKFTAAANTHRFRSKNPTHEAHDPHHEALTLSIFTAGELVQLPSPRSFP
ncbi:hypothetical protein L1049_005184 [Liquidambar formosana]|uniref:Uncharacterized protein n=1 Tax=Liquidambar formosana TaxID=63359 RepID=A0AAP0RQF5_LIQFO